MPEIALNTLAAFAAASALISLAPGPDNIFVLSQSALFGRRAGVLVTLGLCSGLVVHTLAVAFGIAALFQSSPLAFSILKLVGAAYLLYLAWLSFRSSAETDINANALSSSALYRRGVIMNITNPKVSLFFLAFLPQFTDAAVGSLVLQLLYLGAVFIVIALILFSAIAYFGSVLGKWLRESPSAQQHLNRIAGFVFIAIAVKLLLG